MQCQLCGNASKILYRNGEPIVVRLRQCRSCKLILCTECTPSDGHPDAAVEEVLARAGAGGQTSYCPKCRSTQLDSLN